MKAVRIWYKDEMKKQNLEEKVNNMQMTWQQLSKQLQKELQTN